MKRLIVTLASFFVLAFGLAPLPVSAASIHFSATDAKSEICAGIGAASGGSGCAAQGPNVNKVIATVVNLLSFIAGVIAVIMIIVSGLKYMTAAGDSSKISSAKTTLIYALVGLVIVALAQVIVQFVLNEATK